MLTLGALLAMPCLAQAAPKASAQALYKEGLGLIQSNLLAKAQGVLLQAHAQAPLDVPITITLGKVDSLLGRNEDAIKLFREVAAKQPHNGENELNLAITLATQGSLEEALLHASAACDLTGSAGAHHVRGKILDSLGRSKEARAEFESALHIAPDDPSTLFDYALMCESSGELPREIELLRKLTELRPQTSQFHFLLGRALSRADNVAGAQVELREAIRLDPTNRAALYSLSRALAHEDPAESARLNTRFQALRLSEEEMNQLRDQGNQGIAAMNKQDWPRAIALFEAALTTCAGCTLEATLEKDLGLSQCQSGNTQAGALSLRRSLALSPNDLDTLHALELAEHANGHPKD